MRREVAYRPKRHLRNELYSLAAVMFAPLALLCVFPYEAIGWKAAPPPAPAAPAVCAFITLSEADANAAVAAARAAIKTSADGVSRMRADLSLSEIPEPSGGVSDIAERQRSGHAHVVVDRAFPLPPSVAAPPPAAPDPSAPAPAPEPAFPRAHLLEID